MQIFIDSYEEDVARIVLFYFNKICTRLKFDTSFSSLILHAVNLLLWHKILLLTLFRIIAVKRPTTFVRVFLMGRPECFTKGGKWQGVSLQFQKFELSPFLGYCPQQKIEFPYPSPDHRPHIGKNGIYNSFSKSFTKNFACGNIFSYTIMTYLKSLMEVVS